MTNQNKKQSNKSTKLKVATTKNEAESNTKIQLGVKNNFDVNNMSLSTCEKFGEAKNELQNLGQSGDKTQKKSVSKIKKCSFWIAIVALVVTCVGVIIFSNFDFWVNVVVEVVSAVFAVLVSMGILVRENCDKSDLLGLKEDIKNEIDDSIKHN